MNKKQETKNKSAKVEFQNKLFYGDNLGVLRSLKHIKEDSIDLCYIDSPF